MVSIPVTEDAQQDRLSAAPVRIGTGKHGHSFVGSVTHSELEQATAKVSAVFGSAYSNSVALKNLRHRNANRTTLEWRQLLFYPIAHGLSSSNRVVVELECECWVDSKTSEWRVLRAMRRLWDRTRLD